MSSQKISQTNPNAPVAMNADCQPYLTASHGTTSGATTAPIFAPELNSPVASARSLLGNHSATVLMHAGKLAASPSPSSARAMPNVNAETAPACAIAATLQIEMASAYPLRVPSRSINRPAVNNPIAYAAWNAAVM